VGQLHAGNGALLANETSDAREHLDVLVLPDAEIPGTDPPLGRHRRRLGKNEPRPAYGTAAQMHQVPVGGEAIGRRILAHGRNHYAIAQRYITNLQRVEQVHAKLPPGSSVCTDARREYQRSVVRAMRFQMLPVGNGIEQTYDVSLRPRIEFVYQDRVGRALLPHQFELRIIDHDFPVIGNPKLAANLHHDFHSAFFGFHSFLLCGTATCRHRNRKSQVANNVMRL
jgi:hypothetical protein